MPVRPRHVVGVATIVILIALGAPAVALPDGGGKCNASACKVYHESSGPSAGSSGPQQQPPQQSGGPTSTATGGGKEKLAPKGLARVLAQAGADKGPLSHLLTDSGLGSLQTGSRNVGSPGVLGAAFDLGAGPLALLAILLLTALGLAARGSVRGWFLRRRPPTA